MYTSYEDKHNWYLRLLSSGIQGNTAIVAYIISSFVHGAETDMKGWAWPTHEQIAERMGRKGTKADCNQISTWVQTLEEFNWVEIKVKVQSSGGKKNFYRLTDGSTFEKLSRNPRNLTPNPKNPYSETQDSLPRDPVFLGDKSKVKENRKEEERVNPTVVKGIKEEGKDKTAAKAAQPISLISEECISLDSNNGEFPLTSEGSKVSLDVQEVTPNPKKVGVGNEEKKAGREEVIRAYARKLVDERSNHLNQNKKQRQVVEIVRLSRDLDGSPEEVADEAARRIGVLSTDAFDW